MKTLNSRITLTLFILVSSHLLAMAGDVSFKVTKKYLNFPVSHAENRAKMIFEVNGKPDLSVVIRLAPDKAEYWVFKDVSAFKGKTIKITYEGNEKDSARYTSRMKSQDRIVCIRKRIVRSSTLLPGEVGSMTLMD